MAGPVVSGVERVGGRRANRNGMDTPGVPSICHNRSAEEDFQSQSEAQSYFEANGGSPTNNVDNLDADHDGQACESFDYSSGGGTGGDGTGGNGDSLPFTGPASTLLPTGTALLLGGLALVGVTRQRARHARR
jgi:hypothetical protein